MKCFDCNERGHIARDCPRKEDRAESLFVGTVVTEENDSPNSANNNDFYSWWIDDDTIFNKISYPEEGLRMIKGFDKTTTLSDTKFRVGMTLLCEEKGDENTLENEGLEDYDLMYDEDLDNENENMQGPEEPENNIFCIEP
jgi:hypothetical protein